MMRQWHTRSVYKKFIKTMHRIFKLQYRRISIHSSNICVEIQEKRDRTLSPARNGVEGISVAWLECVLVTLFISRLDRSAVGVNRGLPVIPVCVAWSSLSL